jgi:hypothetical protein
MCCWLFVESVGLGIVQSISTTLQYQSLQDQLFSSRNQGVCSIDFRSNLHFLQMIVSLDHKSNWSPTTATRPIKPAKNRKRVRPAHQRTDKLCPRACPSAASKKKKCEDRPSWIDLMCTLLLARTHAWRSRPPACLALSSLTGVG